MSLPYVNCGALQLHRVHVKLCVCAAALSVYLPDPVLEEVSKALVAKLKQKSAKPQLAGSHIQALGAIRQESCC